MNAVPSTSEQAGRLLYVTVAMALVSAAAQPPQSHAAELTRALAPAVESITERELREHVNVLASDTFEGREAGSRGGRAAAAYLVTELNKLRPRGLEPGGPEGDWFQPFGANCRNVLAVLPGRDPDLRKTYVLAGAHFDHVGYGNARNSLGPIGRIHNGADDNASGTAGLLEVIEAILELPERPRRSVVFAFWDSEENDLGGSEHWVRHPTVPLKSIALVLNADMIGRLRSDTLEVFGVRTASGLRQLICEQNAETALRLDFNWALTRDSDHYPFYERRVPFLMLHTMKHDEYHRPSDDAHLVNVPGMRRVSQLLLRLTVAAAEAERLPDFRPECTSESHSSERSLMVRESAPRPRMGVAWDSALAAEGAIRLVRVETDSPAGRAGLQPGDRIIQLGGVAADGGHDFAQLVLAAPKEVQVVVEREGEPGPLALAVELDGEPRRVGISWLSDDGDPGGVILTRVSESSAAWKAGLRPGDRVYAVDGRSYRSSQELLRLLESDDETLSVTRERAGRLATVELALPPRFEPTSPAE
ncbi:MAG: M20/M25/M40 family metallo-hydrolase [Planctomycetes bacterium]|nr:M20/M25/M40 family metallo-hydrolase [Planctomycetota bacterium]